MISLKLLNNTFTLYPQYTTNKYREETADREKLTLFTPLKKKKRINLKSLQVDNLYCELKRLTGCMYHVSDKFHIPSKSSVIQLL